MIPTLIVDIGVGGHRHLHVRFLVEFLQSQPAIWPCVKFYLSKAVIEGVVGGLDDHAAILFQASLVRRDADEVMTFSHVLATARRLSIQQLLFLEVDQVIYQLTWRRLPLRVSGVWFRPNFHYASAGLLHEGWRQRATSLLKACAVRAACVRSNVDRLFVFDAFAAEYAVSRLSTHKIRYVPDPMAFPTAILPSASSGRAGRRVFAVIGSISMRKGIISILAALRVLTESDQNRMELRIVGRAVDSDRQSIAEAIKCAASMTSARITYMDRFVSDGDIDLTILESDVVMLLYQRFIGSSGLLIRAALYGRPVIATKYGLLGALVKTHGLGVTADPYDTVAIAGAMSDVIANGSTSYDRGSARRFANSHSPSAYARQLSEIILGSAN